MNTTFQKPEDDIAVIEIEFTKKEWNEALEAAKQALQSDNADQIREFAIHQQANQALSEIISQEKIKLLSQPTVLGHEDEDGDFSISITCEVLPEIELGKYTGLNIIVPEVSLSEDEINDALLKQISSTQAWEVMPSDYAAKNGDRVIIDYLGEKDGVPFDGGAGKKYPLILGSQSFIPGFEDQLVGIKAGEKRDVKVTFPENYFEPTLAGAPVVFFVTCEAVEQMVKPELTDAFIEKLEVSGIRTVEQLRARIKAEMLAAKQAEAENKAVLEILQEIIKTSSIQVPDSMVQTHIDQQLQQMEQQMMSMGMNLNQYLQMTGQDIESFKEAMKPEAIQNIQAALIIEAVSEEQNLMATQEEINAEYELLARAYNLPAAQLQAFIPPQGIAAQIIQNKTLDYLKKENIKG